MEAFSIAHDRVVNGRKDLLIVILKEKINVQKLPPDLRPNIRMSKCSLNTIAMKNSHTYHLSFHFNYFNVFSHFFSIDNKRTRIFRCPMF